ncbi:hypothetical protein Taro_051374 [Colocasia esculenta]|uniref:Pentatricopeptide repeat-containing protein n=1 Tax=Colocasia esculenta TaxID=4460 RepID=A0A843XFT5_COLES|nr:hypothetical protein [Colocasia esculenta]
MLARGRRLLHAASCRAVEWPSPPKVGPLKTSSWLVLTPRAVESTLSSCPSDVIALSFFLWCARQPEYFHGPRAFSLMVPVMDRLTERFGSVAAVVRELESVGCPRKAQTFLMLMRIYWRGGMFRLVLEAFDEMVGHNYAPNTFARNIVLDVLFKIGSIRRAFVFFTNTQCPNFLTFNVVISNLCRLKDWLGVRAVLRVMVEKRFSLDVGTFSMVLVCLQNAGRVMEVMQLVGFMIVSGKQLTTSVWTILIDAFCRLDRVEPACELLEKMVESGCSSSIVAYTTVIKRLLESRMTGRAFYLLDFMLSSGYKLDLVLCNILIDFFCKSKRYDDAIDLFLGLQKWNLKPDSYTLSSMMTILCASGKIELFPKLIAELDITIDLVTCNSLMNVLCKCGFPSVAVEFYDDMVDRGFLPDKFTFSGLLNALCKSGRIDDAVRVYHVIIKNGYFVDAHIHTVLIDGLIKGRKPHKAIGLFRRALSENYCLDVVSYTTAINGLLKGGMFKEACALFNEMKQFGCAPNTCTYNVMLRGLFKARKIGAVRKLLVDMAESGVKRDCISFNTMISYLLKFHHIHTALHIFTEMCDSGLQPSRISYLLVFNGICCAHAEELEDLYPKLRCCLEETVLMDMDSFDLPDKLFLCSRILAMLGSSLMMEGPSEKLVTAFVEDDHVGNVALA